jgi:hypothetical protein
MGLDQEKRDLDNNVLHMRRSMWEQAISEGRWEDGVKAAGHFEQHLEEKKLHDEVLHMRRRMWDWAVSAGDVRVISFGDSRQVSSMGFNRQS